MPKPFSSTPAFLRYTKWSGGWATMEHQHQNLKSAGVTTGPSSGWIEANITVTLWYPKRTRWSLSERLLARLAKLNTRGLPNSNRLSPYLNYWFCSEWIIIYMDHNCRDQDSLQTIYPFLFLAQELSPWIWRSYPRALPTLGDWCRGVPKGWSRCNGLGGAWATTI